MTGRVTLLGAGPGDPELLTLLGWRRLQEATVVLYDRLVNPSLLLIPDVNTKLINVGKARGTERLSQDQINALLVQYAQAGEVVVRLKAGDPYVFGRGGEEAQYLAAHHINFEVVPGLTSAITGLSAAGIPITNRNYASSFHVITGQKRHGDQQLDWANLAQLEGTLVFLMGMAELPEICRQLIAHGKNPKTPTAVIQWATQWRQKMAFGDLDNIETVVKQKRLAAPALIVIGEVVPLAHQLQVKRSLSARHILAPSNLDRSLLFKLQDLGATVDFYVTSQPQRVKKPLPDFSKFRQLTLKDYFSYQYLVQALNAQQLDIRALAGLQLSTSDLLLKQTLQRQGLQIADDASSTKFENDAKTLIIGPQDLQITAANYYGIYTYQRRELTLEQNLADFQAVIFTCSQDVLDFRRDFSKPESASWMVAFVTSSKMQAAVKTLAFKKVFVLNGDLLNMEQLILEELKHE